MQWLANLILNWISSKLMAWVGGLIAFFKRNKQIDDQRHADVEPLKKADPKDGDAIDKGIDDALDHL